MWSARAAACCWSSRTTEGFESQEKRRIRRSPLPETRGRLSWKRRAWPPLWHANCFRECRQARRKLNRDPAAITSLSVACRYASRPPSVPTNPLPIKNLASRPGSLAFGTNFSRKRNSRPFSCSFELSTRGDRLSTGDASAVTPGQQEDARPCHLDKNCHPRGDVLRRFELRRPTICRSTSPISE